MGKNISTIPNSNNLHQIDKFCLGNKSEEILYALSMALVKYSENIDESIGAFKKAMYLMLENVDYYIFNAYNYKNNDLMLIADLYIDAAIKILENNFVFIKKYNNENLNYLFENYFPIKSIKNRINLIINYYNIGG
ncbi:MAG: hypothetical protein PHC64_09795 [Candidatus Gastranaerophilales bacterium]|nr:hypothetical protein [Candidatus Gastranaerophilales bacterium]